MEHCSFPGAGTMAAFPEADHAYLKITGPSVPLQMPGENAKCSKQGLMWYVDPLADVRFELSLTE